MKNSDLLTTSETITFIEQNQSYYNRLSQGLLKNRERAENILQQEPFTKFSEQLEQLDQQLKDISDHNELLQKKTQELAERTREVIAKSGEEKLKVDLERDRQDREQSELIKLAENEAVTAIAFVNDGLKKFKGEAFTSAKNAVNVSFNLLQAAWNKEDPEDILRRCEIATRAAAASLFLGYAIGRDREKLDEKGLENIQAAMGIYSELISTNKSFSDIYQIYSQNISENGRLNEFCQNVLAWNLPRTTFVNKNMDKTKYETLHAFHHTIEGKCFKLL